MHDSRTGCDTTTTDAGMKFARAEYWRSEEDLAKTAEFRELMAREFGTNAQELANGEERRTVAIVKDGVLNQALADTFSAKKAGASPSGAARAESYASMPMPRMTNTRIEVANPLPLSTDFDDVTPEAVATLLAAHEERLAILSTEADLFDIHFV